MKQNSILSEKNVLITGGAGYIGSLLVNLAPENWKITVLDNCIMGNAQTHFQKNIIFVKEDIRNISIVKNLIEKSDVVIHLAGIVGEASFQKNPKAAWEINQEATEKIVDLVKKFNKKLIFMSTCSVYGFNSEICTEETIPNPVDEYSRSKIKSEQYIQENLENYIIFRLGTVFGWSPRMRFDIIINKIIEKTLWNESIEIFGGKQWRPFIHIKDAGNALILAAEKSIRKEIINIVGENHQLLDVAKQITSNLKIISQKEDNRSYHVSNEKIKNKLNWKPEMGIEKTIQEFKKINYPENIYHNHKWNYS